VDPTALAVVIIVVALGFDFTNEIGPPDNLWNVFHDANGGFFNFLSSALSSGSIAGDLPVDAVISRYSQSAFGSSARAAVLVATTIANATTYLICPPQYPQASPRSRSCSHLRHRD